MILLTSLWLWISSPTIDQVLDQFHQAAAEANSAIYFSLLSEDAVIIGTDVSEIWVKSEFMSFCKPYFERGQGWVYIPTKRKIQISSDGRSAWFVEILKNKSYGTCRGTGVLIQTKEGWRIAQYHLTIPIPNEIAKDVTGLIAEFEKEK
ncbi:MAG: protein with SnoaL 3 domain, NTF 2 superfamily [Acidobacteria bacterium]|nr:MAG: protein with SnoaL 3 domain, NTF 2 superfamily [Acidobacteriota bacterium]